MSIKIHNRYLVLGLFCALTAIFFLGRWSTLKERESVLNDLKRAKNEILTYKAKVGSDSVTISVKEQELVGHREALRELGLNNSDLRALNLRLTSQLTNANFRIDTLLRNVGHGGQIVVIRDTVFKTPVNAILLPFSFEKKDKWLDLKGDFNSQGILDISLGMGIELDVISGIERKTKRPIVTVSTDNLYVQTVSIRSYKTEYIKPHRWGIGVIGGYGVQIPPSLDVSPFIGVGVSYNFITF
jgi:hypothetical protein